MGIIGYGEKFILKAVPQGYFITVVKICGILANSENNCLPFVILGFIL